MMPAKSGRRVGAPTLTRRDTQPATALNIKDTIAAVTGQTIRVHGKKERVDLEREIAFALVKRIGSHRWDSTDAMLKRVHEALLDLNPQTEITLRRLRAIWNKEPARVGVGEVLELIAASSANEEMSR
jgi:hypothetical protein